MKYNIENRANVLSLLGCYFLWGFQPLYWSLNDTLDSFTILAVRIIMASVFSILILAFTGRLGELMAVLRNGRVLRTLALSAVFLLVDWGVFIVAVNSGHVLDAGLGYYFNPLLLFLIGILLYKERCTKMQVFALAVALIGVAVSTVAFGSFPLIAVLIACNWAIYVVLKKNVNLDGVVSVAVETMMMSLPALIFLLLFRRDVMGALHGGEIVFLLGSGVVTALPMFLYTNSVCRLPLIIMCFSQYLSPTFNMICGLLMGERFSADQVVSLVFFGAAIVMFTLSQLRQAKKEKCQQVLDESLAARFDEILRDSLRLMETTVSPKTFFGRYEDVLRNAEKIAETTHTDSCRTYAREIISELTTSRSDRIKAFIDRCDRKGNLYAIKDELLSGYDIPPELKLYTEEIIREIETQSADAPAGGEYIYCSLSFGNGGKTYYYKTTDETLQRGDEVVVPVGNDGRKAIARIETVERFPVGETPYPPSLTKDIPGKCP